MTNVDALKALYVALGGDADDVAEVDQIAEMITALQSVVPTGSGLPEVTAEDNGDILSVVDGEWAKAKPDDTMKVIFATSSNSESKITFEMTGAQLVTYIENHPNVVVSTAEKVSSTKYYYNYNLTGRNSSDGIRFTCVFRNNMDSGTAIRTFFITNSGLKSFSFTQKLVSDPA